MERIELKFNAKQEGDFVIVTVHQIDKLTKEEFIGQYKGVFGSMEAAEKQLSDMPEQHKLQKKQTEEAIKSNKIVVDAFKSVALAIAEQEQKKKEQPKRK